MLSRKQRSEIGRMLQALRKRRRFTCPVCGKAFTGQGRRIYCTPACRQEAYRRRKASR
jgi:hypothetical protein